MQLVLPTLTFRRPDGRLDTTATARYAERAAATWAHLFILSGTTTGGHHATPAERATVVDLWADTVGTDRLTACCWTREDIDHAWRRNVVPMAVLRNLADQAEALDFLSGLPRPVYLFSHPEFSPATCTPALATAAAHAGVLPAAAKVSKMPVDQIRELRASTGPDFTIWDGTARHIADSLTAGTDGIVAAPLSHLPDPFPGPNVTALQHAIDTTQAHLDTLPSREARAAALFHLAARPPGHAA
ncbi:hypothetical protein [Frankia sp. KB5]|uniref:hypothetical protein n=1 Tax=Frankia sp. KB5 TaxID=683318 RepID=UPI000A0F72BC|nr:hypothetical protein [Frankia sp. KB5]ORT51527.1 hypothetical protein KBI5_11600 [Frankia sp. KB5]